MYYVYELKDPKSNIVFYVGKGKGKRASYHTTRNKKGFYTENRYKDNVIRQILLTGLDPIIEYVFYSPNEEEAYTFEEALIKKYGRRLFEDNGILTNICESSNPPHLPYTDERKEVYRRRMVGNTYRLGLVQTEEEKLARSLGLIKAYNSGNRTFTEESKRNLDQTGKIRSTESKNKISSTRIEKGLNIPVTIDNVEYASILDASKKLGITQYMVKKLNVNK